MRALVLACGALLLGSVAAFAAFEPATNGFDVANSAVPANEILGGGPKRDGVRSVDEPKFVSSGEADWVQTENPVLVVELEGEMHIYPVHLIEYHQIVNDRFGDRSVVVTYDPLAGIPRAFDATVDGKAQEFGVAGLIYNHNFLLYDRATESLWQQITGEAIAGKAKGKKLTSLRIRQEPLGSALHRNPGAKVLAKPLDQKIDYALSPFARYWETNKALFPLKATDPRFHLKEVVLGLRSGDKTRVYLGSLATVAGGEVEDEFDGKKIRFVYDAETSPFRYEVPEGVEVIESYWLAWKSWFADTEIWSDPGPIPDAPPTP